ncbi:MAG: metallophosphoesterase [Pyrinomonadaceae bacterium]
MNTEVVLAHISDLHFPHWRDSTLQNLKDYLKRKRPLLILVTGDLTDNPFPWQQRRLKHRLDELVESCRDGAARQPHLVVVPGNHDYAVLGNWNFGLSPLPRTTFRHIFRDYRRRFIEITAGDLTIYVFCFNSNPYIARWAKGAISRRQLKWFEKKTHALRNANKEKFESAYKIAILHHHPLPIPFSEELEKFLILKNAGELLRLLAQCKINLVLHGHKHESVISSVNMGTSYGATRKLFVVASGTTLKRGDGKNTCNLITIRHRGQAEVTPAVAQPDEEFLDKETVLLPPWDDYIREQYAFQQERVGYEIDEYIKEIEIDDEGDSVSEMKINGLRVTDLQKFRNHRDEASAFHLYTETGRLVPEVEFQKSNPALQPIKGEVDDLYIRGSWGLPYSPDLQSSYAVEVKYLTLNAWAMNTEEFERKYSPDPGERQEEEWFICMAPIKVFRQVIYFPSGWKPEGKPSLRIYSSTDGEQFSAESEAWLEKHHANALSYNDKSNTITLIIQKPLYGFKYVVGWFLPQLKTLPDPATAVELHKRRVGILIERMNETPGELDDFMKVLMEIVCSDLVDVLADGLDGEGKGKLKEKIKSEPIDISIAIPARNTDEDRPLLEIIAYNLDREGIKSFKFPVGEGVAGRAYKLNGVRTYLRRTGPKRLVKEDFIYIPFGESNDHSVIYSVPLRHPKNRDLLIGVLTVGSRSSISRLIPTEDHTLEKISKTLIDITAAYVVKRLSDLYGNILEI